MEKNIEGYNKYTLNGDLIKQYPSCSIAANELHLDKSTMSKVCRGVNKTHGGYIFKYAE